MSSDERYLKKVRQTWYVRIKVPATVRHHYTSDHWWKSLQTDSLAIAQKKKHAVIALAQEEFRRKTSDGIEDRDARGFREAIREADADPIAPGLPSPRDLLEVAASNHEDELIERGMNRRAADTWYRLATSVRPTLDECLDDWLASIEKAGTRLSYRRAVMEFREFLGGNRPLDDIDREVARRYVREHMAGRGQAYETQRRKIKALAALWNWLADHGRVPDDRNPWHGFKLKKTRIDRERPEKRAYTDGELVTLLSGDAQYPGLAHLIILGLLTGARLEELAARQAGDFERRGGDVVMLRIGEAKTRAGRRRIAVSHPAALAILHDRMDAADGADAMLFPELVPGGPDQRRSWNVSKKFGRFRDALGLSRETDFHSLRRTFMTCLENVGVDQVRISRYVGHEVGTMAADVYSAGSSEKTSIEVARMVRYAEEVEQALVSFAARAPEVGQGVKGRWGARTGQERAGAASKKEPEPAKAA